MTATDQSAERCPDCDRPGCNRREAEAAYAAVLHEPLVIGNVQARTRARVALADANIVCGAHRVDWRARCLEAREHAAWATLHLSRMAVAVGLTADEHGTSNPEHVLVRVQEIVAERDGALTDRQQAEEEICRLIDASAAEQRVRIDLRAQVAKSKPARTVADAAVAEVTARAHRDTSQDAYEAWMQTNADLSRAVAAYVGMKGTTDAE